MLNVLKTQFNIAYQKGSSDEMTTSTQPSVLFYSILLFHLLMLLYSLLITMFYLSYDCLRQSPPPPHFYFSSLHLIAFDSSTSDCLTVPPHLPHILYLGMTSCDSLYKSLLYLDPQTSGDSFHESPLYLDYDLVVAIISHRCLYIRALSLEDNSPV